MSRMRNLAVITLWVKLMFNTSIGFSAPHARTPDVEPSGGSERLLGLRAATNKSRKKPVMPEVENAAPPPSEVAPRPSVPPKPFQNGPVGASPIAEASASVEFESSLKDELRQRLLRPPLGSSPTAASSKPALKDEIKHRLLDRLKSTGALGTIIPDLEGPKPVDNPIVSPAAPVARNADEKALMNYRRQVASMVEDSATATYGELDHRLIELNEMDASIEGDLRFAGATERARLLVRKAIEKIRILLSSRDELLSEYESPADAPGESHVGQQRSVQPSRPQSKPDNP